MQQFIEIETNIDGGLYGYPEASSMYLDGCVYYKEVDASFDHEFGTEKRTDYKVDDMMLHVQLFGKDGEVVDSFDLDNCANIELLDKIETIVSEVDL